MYLQNKLLWDKVKKWSRIGQQQKSLRYRFLRNFCLLWPNIYFWMGDWVLDSVSSKFWYLRNISQFLNILSLKLGNTYTKYTQSILKVYSKSSPALIVVNQSSTEMLNCFIILFPRLYICSSTTIRILGKFLEYCLFGVHYTLLHYPGDATYTVVYSEPWQTYKKRHSEKIVNVF